MKATTPGEICGIPEVLTWGFCLPTRKTKIQKRISNVHHSKSGSYRITSASQFCFQQLRAHKKTLVHQVCCLLNYLEPVNEEWSGFWLLLTAVASCHSRFLMHTMARSCLCWHRIPVWYLCPYVPPCQLVSSHLCSFNYVFVPCNKVGFLSFKMSVKILRKWSQVHVHKVPESQQTDEATQPPL